MPAPIEVDNLDGTKIVVGEKEFVRVPTEPGPNVLVLEGPLRWDYHEGWSIGDNGDVLQEMWFKWPETSSGEGPHGSFRITIERLE